MPEMHNISEKIFVIELLKERYMVAHKVTSEFLDLDIRVAREISDHMLETLTFKLQKEIAYEKKKWTEEVEIPASGWQFFKLFYMPRWYQWLYPITLKKVQFHFKANVKYLDIPVSLRDKRPTIVITELNPDWPDFWKRVKERTAKADFIENYQLEVVDYESSPKE